MKYTLIMQTCNRQEKVGGENLILETLESLIESGLWESNIDFHLVIHDSGSVDKSFLEPFKILDKTTIVSCKDKELNLRNVQYSLTYAMENHPCDYVINLEDDIIFCKNWIQNVDAWIRKNITEEDIFFTFFTPYDIPNILRNIDRDIQVWSEYKTDWFYGNQCIGFPYKQLPNVIKILKDETDITRNADIVFHKWLSPCSKTGYIKASVPCLVQHRNLHSTLTHNAEVLSFTFLGEDIDPKLYE